MICLPSIGKYAYWDPPTIARLSFILFVGSFTIEKKKATPVVVTHLGFIKERDSHPPYHKSEQERKSAWKTLPPKEKNQA
jgi:hypothetical protein